jgi:hypothetical protein
VGKDVQAKLVSLKEWGRKLNLRLSEAAFLQSFDSLTHRLNLLWSALVKCKQAAGAKGAGVPCGVDMAELPGGLANQNGDGAKDEAALLVSTAKLEVELEV